MIEPMRIPDPLKQAFAVVATAASPQCRFDRALFVLGHMRCGSTALSRVLGNHPEISGQGEAHIGYRGRAALGQLLLAQMRRRSWKPGARYLHDKVLHNRYDAAVPAGFARARAVFLLREPLPTIRSIRHLFRTIGSSEYANDALAADYYAERLDQLAGLWRLFPAQRRIGIDFAELTAGPEAVLARLSGFLGLQTPLANAYGTAGPERHGMGDPLTSPRLSAIVGPAKTAPGQSDDGLPALPQRRIAELELAHYRVRQLICGDPPGSGDRRTKDSSQAR